MWARPVGRLREEPPRRPPRTKGSAHIMNPDSALVTKPARRTFVVADLKCYLCGTVSGSIEREQTPTPLRGVISPVALRRPGQTHAILVADWRRLRCDRCGGPLFLDETDVIVRRTEDDYN